MRQVIKQTSDCPWHHSGAGAASLCPVLQTTGNISSITCCYFPGFYTVPNYTDPQSLAIYWQSNTVSRPTTPRRPLHQQATPSPCLWSHPTCWRYITKIIIIIKPLTSTGYKNYQSATGGLIRRDLERAAGTNEQAEWLWDEWRHCHQHQKHHEPHEVTRLVWHPVNNAPVD